MSDNVTTFEDLSDELCMDIYEYLDAYQLFDAFQGLNYRFNHILNDNRLRLHSDSNNISDEKFNEYWKYFLPSICDRLTSLTLSYRHENIALHSKIDLSSSLSLDHQYQQLKFYIDLRWRFELQNNESSLIWKLILFENYLPQLKVFSYISNNGIKIHDHYKGLQSTITSNNIENLTIGCSTNDILFVLEHTPKLKQLDFTVHYCSRITQKLSLFPTIKYLKMAIIYLVIYADLMIILKTMPYLKIFELTGQSCDKTFLDGQKLIELLPASIHNVKLDILISTVGTSQKLIDQTISSYSNNFWHDVKCFEKDDYYTSLSAIGLKK
ncbi:unnamed protein product [Didymodactylos carnosus]|uniref:F-box domain-containing protein n=1 Tax=Didymodactylos carnosus TaxID=1234261 RepID=A0A8S2CLZ3_9BILA|nr:unnamed protein product [Didymodactylos carnosus]CAF3522491.1 unnamed protein product [Didymodactylos carnosus]